MMGKVLSLSESRDCLTSLLSWSRCSFVSSDRSSNGSIGECIFEDVALSISSREIFLAVVILISGASVLVGYSWIENEGVSWEAEKAREKGA